MENNPAEQWMEIPGFPGYRVSDAGKVKRVVKKVTGKGDLIMEKPMKPRLVNGYYAYTLIGAEGKKKTVYLHKAVAQCFVENKAKQKLKMIVVHKDGDKINNRPENLEWKSYAGFMRGEFKKGKRSNSGLWKKRIEKYGPMGSRRKPGKKNPLSAGDITDICKKYAAGGYTLKKLAAEYQCSPSHIYNTIRWNRKS